MNRLNTTERASLTFAYVAAALAASESAVFLFFAAKGFLGGTKSTHAN